MPKTDAPVTEVIDTVPSGMLSHFLVGSYDAVMERMGQIRARYGTARCVAINGNGKHDHAEAVLHRPHPGAPE
jgi:alkanesulfonate monooxygenase SsuD/methylene tetrahydromethanopterin reductase-like flavin-dependent oxidoreductase (luciferase family)